MGRDRRRLRAQKLSVCVSVIKAVVMVIGPTHCSLEFQVSSLEKDMGAKQETIGRYESQLAELQGKYEACPKPEVVERCVCVCVRVCMHACVCVCVCIMCDNYTPSHCLCRYKADITHSEKEVAEARQTLAE